MDSKEYRFYLSHGSAAQLYKVVILGFLCFSVLFVYGQLGLTAASRPIYAFLLLCGGILVYPMTKAKKPLYIVDSAGIRQNKYPILQRKLCWSDIDTITYPASGMLGGAGAVCLDMQNTAFNALPFIISLSDIDDPVEFLAALNNFKPFGYDQLQARSYFQRNHDKEKMLYVTLLYMCVGISVLLMATFDMPYVWLEDNRYGTFWAVLFFVHLFLTIGLSIAAYKDIQKRKAIVLAAIVFWFFVTLGPFVVEQNAYYNVKAIMAEKKGDFDSAEKNIRRAIQIHPEGYSYHETLGRILFQKGQFAESADQFRFLLDTDRKLTNYYLAYYRLWIGKSLLKLNKTEAAKEEFRKVRDANIDDFNKELAVLDPVH